MNTRQIAHRKLNQAIAHLENLDKCVFEVGTVYDDLHKEVSTPLFLLIEMSDEIKKVINKVKEKI